MRRLRSSFTLLSSDPSSQRQEETYDLTTNSNQQPQFTWAELFSAEPPAYPSTPPDFLHSSQISFSDYSNPQPEALYSQNFVQQQQYPKCNPWDEPEELGADGTPIEILSADNEQSYAAIDPIDHLYHQHVEPLQHSYPVVTPYGTVSILMRHLIRVDISPEGAVFVQNCCSRSSVVLNGAGDKSCVVHSNSRVYQEGQETHVMTCQGRMAKICQRGVVFAASTLSLAYLVDASGTKSTADRFADLRRDFSMDVFNDRCEAISVAQCYDMVSKAVYTPLANGDDVWMVGATKVKQDRYGNIEVSQERRLRVVTVLPTVDEISVHTAFVSVTVGSYSKRYLSVQMDNRRITSGFCGLTAQIGSQKAGIDRNGKVAIL